MSNETNETEMLSVLSVSDGKCPKFFFSAGFYNSIRCMYTLCVLLTKFTDSLFLFLFQLQQVAALETPVPASSLSFCRLYCYLRLHVSRYTYLTHTITHPQGHCVFPWTACSRWIVILRCRVHIVMSLVGCLCHR